MLSLIHEIAQSLRTNRTRTILTGIAVAWGIFMLIILLGASRGVINSFEYNMASRPLNTFKIWSGRTSMPYKGYKDGRWIQLKGSDINAIENDNPNVSKVTAYASVDTTTISTPKGRVSGGFNALFPSAIKNERYEIKYGRGLNDRDMAECRRVMIISENKVTELFNSPEEAIGKSVKCLGLAWTVVGVYSHRWDNQTLAPYTTYKAVTGNSDDAYSLEATVEGLRTRDDAEAAEKGVRASLAAAHEFHPDDPGAVWVWNRFEQYLQTQQGMGYLTMAVWVIGLLTLLTGIVGVSNIMFVSVRERTHEIGIRRAIGARPRQILTQILAESVSITALFGYIGVFLGIAVLAVIDHFFGETDGFRHPQVNIAIAIQVTLALIAAGGIAGLFPALKAIKVKPVEALRDE